MFSYVDLSHELKPSTVYTKQQPHSFEKRFGVSYFLLGIYNFLLWLSIFSQLDLLSLNRSQIGLQTQSLLHSCLLTVSSAKQTMCFLRSRAERAAEIFTLAHVLRATCHAATTFANRVWQHSLTRRTASRARRARPRRLSPKAASRRQARSQTMHLLTSVLLRRLRPCQSLHVRVLLPARL